ncbi:MAG: hypothetical protein QNJ31_03065 [Candidatus Caenarcaniphilales bacterium]|nr:hypothetical protein [Candidatus Caenarcaniphilales bacterium]
MSSELRISGINPNPQNPKRNRFSNSTNEEEDTSKDQSSPENNQEDSFVSTSNCENLNSSSTNESNLINKIKLLISRLTGFDKTLDNKKKNTVI